MSLPIYQAVNRPLNGLLKCVKCSVKAVNSVAFTDQALLVFVKCKALLVLYNGPYNRKHMDVCTDQSCM